MDLFLSAITVCITLLLYVHFSADVKCRQQDHSTKSCDRSGEDLATFTQRWTRILLVYKENGHRLPCECFRATVILVSYH